MNRNEKQNTEGMIVETLIEVVRDFTSTYSDKLIEMAVSGDRKEIDKKHRDNFVSQIDMELHHEYESKLSEFLPSFIYVSEEGDPQIYPSGSDELPEYMAIVDPLDTSELAVRGLCGYTHVLVYSLKEQTPVASVVGDMFHKIQIFYAFRDQKGKDEAFLIKRGSSESQPIGTSQEQRLNKALVTNYSMWPQERFMKMAKQKRLLNALAKPDEKGQERGRIGLDFGSIGLCHVAAGFSDAMVEIAKGFSLWDYFPGLYILYAAGGVAVSLDGSELALNLDIHNLDEIYQLIEKRQKFVAAGNSILLKSILEVLE